MGEREGRDGDGDAKFIVVGRRRRCERATLPGRKRGASVSPSVLPEIPRHVALWSCLPPTEFSHSMASTSGVQQHLHQQNSMGADGGSIPDRRDLVKTRGKAEKADKGVARERFFYCALSRVRLWLVHTVSPRMLLMAETPRQARRGRPARQAVQQGRDDRVSP